LTTQHFTQGRAIFVLAAGEWKNIGPYGYDHRLRDSRLVETARLVRAFLETQEPISYDGRFWKLNDAVVELPPYEGVPPPLWLAKLVDDLFCPSANSLKGIDCVS